MKLCTKNCTVFFAV